MEGLPKSPSKEESLGSEIIREIEEIQKGRDLGILTVKELALIKARYIKLKQELGINVKSSEGTETSYEQAQEIMGEDFYGAEEIKNAFGFEIVESEIPPITYSLETLEKAKELGEMLILRVGRDGDGNPLTMEKINKIMEERMDKDKDGKLLYAVSWYKEETFYKKILLKTEWKLVGKNFVPDVLSEKDKDEKFTKDSRGNNYIHQTRMLREYLKFTESLSEEDTDNCSDEVLKKLSEKMGVDWESQQITDSDRYDANWKEVAKELSELLINKNHRRMPVEVIYDWVLQFRKTEGRGVLEKNYDWTATLSSYGELVDLGYADRDGVNVSNDYPGQRDDDLGVVSLR